MNRSCDVLVVDDEPVVCSAIHLVLEAEGFTVIDVSDAEAALAHPALAGCRVVLCDLMLPGLSGLDAVRAMRRRRPGLPIVIMTGYATAESPARSLEAGATAFLAKPFDDRELLELVRHVLGQTNAAAEEDRS
jgi:DNA-binding NtrC family response regulator